VYEQLFYSKEQLVLKHGGNLRHLKITHPLPHHGSKIVFDEFDGLIDHDHWSATTMVQPFHDKLLVDNTSTNHMVSTALKNIIWSDCIIIPTIGENKSHVPNHQPEYIFFMEFPMNFRVESEDLAPRRAFPPPAGAALPSAGVAGVSPGPP
jgi:hypothetical protein